MQQYINYIGISNNSKNYWYLVIYCNKRKLNHKDASETAFSIIYS